MRINIIISTSQDGEGDFCIHGGLNGPNLYGLNKKVEDWTRILEITHGMNGFEPDFTMLDPFSIDFYANDVIGEVCTEWIINHWGQIDESKTNVAISVYSEP